MDRREPSLVPEWLKGASGTAGATHHVQPSVAHQDRRVVGGGRSSVNERPLQDQDPYLRGYAHFDRSPAVRSYEGAEYIDRDAQRDSDREWGWDSDRDRDGRDRDRVVGFRGKDEWDRHREHLDTALPIRRPGLGPNLGVRYEAEPLPLSSSLSMSSMACAIGNGDKKMVFGELGGLPSVAPASSGSLTSNMQKAAFERNFPTLGAQEKGATGVVVQPNVLSPRPLWQGSSTTRLDGTRSSTSSPGLPSSGPNYGLAAAAGSSGGSNGAEGWSSALAEAPSALMGSSAAVNGTVVAGPTTNNMSSVSSVAMVITTSDSNSANPPKMVDALVQFPPRVRTPPQHSAETQRLEELALKQSRQLTPMRPSLPKNMGLSPREKLKPKVAHAPDVVAPPVGTKGRQAMGSSQVLGSPYRMPALQRSETSKPLQGGKVLDHKMNKEIVSVLPSTQLNSALKSNSSPVGPVSTGASLGLAVGNASGGGGNIGYTPRKQMQLLDRHDRRSPLPTQNRVDFFNALRKKASVGSALNTEDNQDVITTKKSGLVRSKELVTSLGERGVSSPDGAEGDSLFDSAQLENGAAQLSSMISNGDIPAIVDKFYVNVEEKETESSIHELIMQEGPNEELFGPEVLPSVTSSVATASEEEETAFLRSLGWEENAEDGEEALTEEEITAFYQERMRLTTVSRAMQNSSNCHNVTDLQVGSVGNLSSGLSSSDSESDHDCQRTPKDCYHHFD
ncbi:unnamed protein product [Sphagnum balticum]